MNGAAILVYRLFLMALGGLPLLFLAGLLLSVWIDPMSVDDGGWIRIASVLILVEFLLLHSGAFMAIGPVLCRNRWQRLAWFAGFGLVYVVSLVGIAIWSEGNYVFLVLLSVVLSRLLTLVILDDKRGTILLLQRSVFGTVLLLLTAFMVLIPWPQLGLTEAIRHATFGVAEDLLTEHPQRTIAWGATYYLLMAAVECVVGWNTPGWSNEEVDRTWEKLRAS